MKEELLKGLTQEQIAKVKSCKTQDDFLKLAKAEGVELTNEQLEAVSGGSCYSEFDCPKCKGKIDYSNHDGDGNYTCPHCGYQIYKPQTRIPW